MFEFLLLFYFFGGFLIAMKEEKIKRGPYLSLH
jgi:hypothetical protein